MGNCNWLPPGVELVEGLRNQKKEISKCEFLPKALLSIWSGRNGSLPSGSSGWLCTLSALPFTVRCHATRSNLQRPWVKWDVNEADNLPRARGRNPHPRPTDSLPWTVGHPPTLLGNRDVCQLQGHWSMPGAQNCCWLFHAEGQREV